MARWLPIRRGAPGGTPAPAGDAADAPLWAPCCSGVHYGDHLVVIQNESDGSQREWVLRGHHVRLWCLCGGGFSRQQIASTLAREAGLPPEEAADQVSQFIDGMTHRRCLIRLPCAHAIRVPELECPPALRRLT